MQVMPATYAELRARHRRGANIFYPRDNILAGSANMRETRDRFGWRGFLAVYHAWLARYDDYPTSGRPLLEKSRRQVADLAPRIGMRAPEFASIGAARAQQETPPQLFVERLTHKTKARRTCAFCNSASIRRPSETHPIRASDVRRMTGVARFARHPTAYSSTRWLVVFVFRLCRLERAWRAMEMTISLE
jgi:hypothetical protein